MYDSKNKSNYSPCRILNEVCQYNKLDIKYSYNIIGGFQHQPIYLCNIIITDINDFLILDIESTGIGKKASKHNTSDIALKNDSLKEYIYININKNKYSEPIKENEYIKWGSKLIEDEYKLFINDLDSLELFNGDIIAVDTEGFCKDNKFPQMIQIADNKTVALFDYKKFYNFTKNFLENKTLILCDAKSDLKYLCIDNNNFIDIQQEYLKYNNNTDIMSLKKMAGQMTGQIFKKPKGNFYRYEKWNIYEIDNYHLMYAATDAIVTYKLYKYLNC